MPSFIFSTNSTFKAVWDIFMIVIAVAVSFIVPFSISLKPPYSNTTEYELAMLAVSIIYFIDIVFTLRTAILDIMSGEEIKKPSQIAKRYIFSFQFILDVLGCIPWD